MDLDEDFKDTSDSQGGSANDSLPTSHSNSLKKKLATTKRLNVFSESFRNLRKAESEHLLKELNNVKVETNCQLLNSLLVSNPSTSVTTNESRKYSRSCSLLLRDQSNLEMEVINLNFHVIFASHVYKLFHRTGMLEHLYLSEVCPPRWYTTKLVIALIQNDVDLKAETQNSFEIKNFFKRKRPDQDNSQNNRSTFITQNTVRRAALERFVSRSRSIHSYVSISWVLEWHFTFFKRVVW